MEITHTAFKHSDLLKISGRIDSATSPQLADALSKITDNGGYRIVLDLSEVSFISSAGLRVLISAQKTCKRYNRGEVVLAAVPANIMAALELAGFTTLFKIFPETLEAVGSF
ncbi:MAG TPA: STAS domain-containing protein [Chloroflexi bacterium]|jgi:anti-sigma B factor antagonist|nr:STAS domain-containing protein [Chloroflexota bacterium]HPO59106.1 STAS domain-containing protein [Anaerolineaceae bacterium]